MHQSTVQKKQISILWGFKFPLYATDKKALQEKPNKETFLWRLASASSIRLVFFKQVQISINYHSLLTFNISNTVYFKGLVLLMVQKSQTTTVWMFLKSPVNNGDKQPQPQLVKIAGGYVRWTLWVAFGLLKHDSIWTDLQGAFFLFLLSCVFVVETYIRNVFLCYLCFLLLVWKDQFLPPHFCIHGFFRCVIVMESHLERCWCQVVCGQLGILGCCKVAGSSGTAIYKHPPENKQGH